MRGMRAAHTRLDAYSHHPYPVTRGERPSGFARGVCRYCKGLLTLANLPVLLKEVRRDFGPKRIWLTEYGYQTNPPDRFGVSRSVQAKYVAQAALRAKSARFVDVLIHFIVRDEPHLAGWPGQPSSARTPAWSASRRGHVCACSTCRAGPPRPRRSRPGRSSSTELSPGPRSLRGRGPGPPSIRQEFLQGLYRLPPGA